MKPEICKDNVKIIYIRNEIQIHGVNEKTF